MTIPSSYNKMAFNSRIESYRKLRFGRNIFSGTREGRCNFWVKMSMPQPHNAHIGNCHNFKIVGFKNFRLGVRVL